MCIANEVERGGGGGGERREVGSGDRRSEKGCHVSHRVWRFSLSLAREKEERES